MSFLGSESGKNITNRGSENEKNEPGASAVETMSKKTNIGADEIETMTKNLEDKLRYTIDESLNSIWQIFGALENLEFSVLNLKQNLNRPQEAPSE